MQCQQFWWLRLILIIIFITFKEVVHGDKEEDAKAEFEKVKLYLRGKVSGIIDTEYGKVRGRLYKALNGEYYQSFSNIPYARAPILLNRFQKPSPPDKWKYWVDASLSVDYEELTVRCKQLYRGGYEPNSDQVVGYEDCLRLTIIRPADTELEKKRRKEEDIIHYDPHADVLVFLHPGTFMYDISMNQYRIAEHLCCNYMIFVFVRFRLGVLGFANLGGDSRVVPNVGLWDQVAALKWVQRNIVNFGGDPGKVTIAGVAAGAASVNYHLLSQHSQGLFKRAISVGGSALCPWALAERSIPKTLTMAESLGCGQSRHVDTGSCLLNQYGDALVNYTDVLYSYKNLPMNPLGPVVDYDFIDEHPDILMRAKRVNNVPWLVSFSKDLSIYPNHDYLYELASGDYNTYHWYQLAPYMLGLENRVDESIARQVIQQIKRFYMPSVTFYTRQAKLEGLSQMMSDRQYTTGIVEAARLHGLAGNMTKTYLYQFSFKTRSSAADFMTVRPSEWLENHKHEFALLSKDPHYKTDDERRESALQPEGAETDFENDMRVTLTMLWASFIHDGTPSYDRVVGSKEKRVHLKMTTENKSEFVTPFHVQYLRIDGPPQRFVDGNDDDLGNMNFWRKIPQEIYDEIYDPKVPFDVDY